MVVKNMATWWGLTPRIVGYCLVVPAMRGMSCAMWVWPGAPLLCDHVFLPQLLLESGFLCNNAPCVFRGG
jgi:hypothetical protein